MSYSAPGPSKRIRTDSIEIKTEVEEEECNESLSDIDSVVDTDDDYNEIFNALNAVDDDGAYRQNGDENEFSNLDDLLVHDNCYMKDIKFKLTRQLNIVPPMTPIEYFLLFFDEVYLNEKANKLNEIAPSLFLNKNNDKDQTWRDTNAKELKIFLGLLLHMGVFKMTNIRDYWKTHRLYNFCYRKYMSRSRFLSLLKAVTADQRVEFHKIIDHFNSVMEFLYYPAKDLRLEELAAYENGRFIMRSTDLQKNGTKLYLLCEVDGTVLRCAFHQNTGHSKDHEGIILNMMGGYLSVGHSLYLHNGSATYSLAEKLLEYDTYLTGVTQRVDMLPSIVNQHLEPGTSCSRFSLTGVHMGKYRNMSRKETFYISTEFDEGVEQMRNSAIILPIVLAKHMQYTSSSTEVKKKLLPFFPLEHARLDQQMVIFVQVLMMSLSNAHVLYNKYCQPDKPVSFGAFRDNVLERLLPANYNKVGKEVDTTVSEECAKHRMSKMVSESDGASGESSRKNCEECRRHRRRRPTVYCCRGCEGSPAMCMDCFFTIHALKK